MKLPTFPAAFLAAFAIAGLAADPVQSLLLKRGAHLTWDPIDAYSDEPDKKTYWEVRCHQVLIRKGCRTGVIHEGETKLIRNGKRTYYVNVEGAPTTGMKHKKMRVFHDGSSEDGWSWRDRKSLRDAQGKRKNTQLQEAQGQQGQEGQNVLLSWDPADAYDNSQPEMKYEWEKTCRPALAREGCRVGLIHKGETKSIRNGGETAYVKVEGALSPGMEYAKKLRVFQDGSSEDVTGSGWSKRDWKAIGDAKRLHQVPKRLKTQVLPMGSAEVSTSPQAPAKKHPQGVSWSPPDAYGHIQTFRKSYERACHKAIGREGCDFGVIHQGYHRLKNSDGTSKPGYLNVSAGKDGDPDYKRYMRLYEDGRTELYTPGPLPLKDALGVDGKRLNTQIRAPYNHLRGRPRQGVSTDTQVQEPSPSPQLQEASTVTPEEQWTWPIRSDSTDLCTWKELEHHFGWC